MSIHRFSEAFEHGKALTSKLGEIVVECREIGEILLPSGQVVACDPIHLYDLDPYVKKIPPGRYSVILSVVHREGNKEQRISSAMIRVSIETPVRWERAMKARQDIDDSEGDEEIHGYGVDVGYGSLMDLEAARLLRKRMNEDDRYHDHIFELAEENEPEWANIVLDSDTELNLVVVEAGLGDGLYFSYWGYDKSGNIACLVTLDFGQWTISHQAGEEQQAP